MGERSSFPIYCDNRKSCLTRPCDVRARIASELIEDRYGKPDGIAGVATGGMPLARWWPKKWELPSATSELGQGPRHRPTSGGT